MSTKKYYATRDFNDAGSQRSFEAGEELADVKDGQLKNYEFSGLASTQKPGAADASVAKSANDKSA